MHDRVCTSNAVKCSCCSAGILKESIAKKQRVSHADQFTVPRTTVWIGHLPAQFACEPALRRVFSTCGEIVHVTVRYRSNGRGWALLTFRTNKEAMMPLKSGFKDGQFLPFLLIH